jgi:hypothetical protein
MDAVSVSTGVKSVPLSGRFDKRGHVKRCARLTMRRIDQSIEGILRQVYVRMVVRRSLRLVTPPQSPTCRRFGRRQ